MTAFMTLVWTLPVGDAEQQHGGFQRVAVPGAGAAHRTPGAALPFPMHAFPSPIKISSTVFGSFN